MFAVWGISLRNRSLVIKILFFYLLVILLFLVFLFVFFFQKIEDESIADQVKYLANYSHLMEDKILVLLGTNKKEEIQKYISEKARYTDSRITLIDPDGWVLADSIENPLYMDNHAGRPEIKKALSGQNNFIIRYSNTLKKNMLYYAYLVKENNKAIGVLRTSVFIDDMDKLIIGLKIQYLLIISFLIAVSIGGILIIHYNFKREIERFSAISRKVSEGNFDIQFSKNESYEIKELSKSFKNMITKIKTLISELVFEKEEIESIISSIDEGIAVIDQNGKITRANGSFLKIFDAQTIDNKYYWEIIRVNEIVEFIKTGDNRENKVMEVEVYKKIFLCGLNRLPLRNELVLVFYNITGLKNWETMKKELVTNVSHELGTPLTAIRGYVETLLDNEKDEDRLKYLNIISRHTERLNNIIKDLSTLSQLEEKNAAPLNESVNIKDVISNILPIFNDKIKEKGLNLTFAADDNLKMIKGDSFKLEQAFINLLDNAVKYTEKGEIAITITNEGNRVKVEIKDTGLGIPETDLERIFERFYVVDKSRSRAQGGTGLGLAIVKHIVALHGGGISVQSKLGSGTVFILSFPAFN
jgi:two-component system phosphate regulon sensor histidine kinase PhoR